MFHYKPNTFDGWSESQALKFDSYANNCNEINYAAVEVLTVHVINANYFETYAQ